MTDADALMALMAQDKKVKRGKLTFILLQAIGRAVVANDVEPALVRDFLQQKLSDENGIVGTQLGAGVAGAGAVTRHT